MELKYVKQRHEGIEAWIRYNDSEWIRLDFILEYYLFKNVDLSKKYKGRLNEELVVKQYSELFYAKFAEKTSNGSEFDFIGYVAWKKSNQFEINKARNLLSAI